MFTITKDEFLYHIKEDPNCGLSTFLRFSEINDIKETFLKWYSSVASTFANNNSLKTNSTDFQKHSDKLIEMEGGGMCYNNSQKILIMDDTFSYCEGFYSTNHHSTFKPISNHAFNSKCYKIADFTVTLNETITSYFYFGISIPNKDAIKLLEIALADSNKILDSKSAVLSLTIPYFLLLTEGEDFLRNKKWYFTPPDMINN